jgi:hypothetical protein
MKHNVALGCKSTHASNAGKGVAGGLAEMVERGEGCAEGLSCVWQPLPSSSKCEARVQFSCGVAMLTPLDRKAEIVSDTNFESVCLSVCLCYSWP